MSGHLVIPFPLQPGNVKTIVMHPVVHVIVLPAPAPKHIGVPVDQPNMLGCHGSDASKYCGVWQFVVKGGHPGGHVLGLGRAVVQVCIIHWEEVDALVLLNVGFAEALKDFNFTCAKPQQSQR